MSFFDEDDEPRTRVRPRRPATARTGRPDRQTVLLRQGLLFGGFIVVLVLLIFIVNGCRQSAKENSLKEYNRDVAALVVASDREVGKPFFDLMRDPDSGIRNQVASFKAQADQQYQQAKRISTPGDLTAAQRAFLMTMEMRRDGLQSIADRISTALGSDTEASDRAIQEIAGAMEYFLASDVVYTSRTQRFIQDALDKEEIGGQQIQRTQFFPGWQWLDPNTVADALGQQLSADGAAGAGGREPAPGLHGTGIDSVSVGDVTLQPGTANRITYGPDTEFNVAFTNQGEHDEVDIDVVLRIEGGPEPIRVTDNVPSLAAGASATASFALETPPPFDTPVTISVEVKPVPGEEKRDNNSAEYDALFSQQ